MKKIAVLLHDTYHDTELWVPYYRLLEAGYDVKLVGAADKTQYLSKLGYPTKADILSKDCRDEDFEGVVVPGGYAPDKIRADVNSLAIVQKAFNNNKLIASICHGQWVLISAGILKEKKATCFVNIKDDVTNAGAIYLDEEVVVDANLITSRKPDDLPAFCREIVNYLETN